MLKYYKSNDKKIKQDINRPNNTIVHFDTSGESLLLQSRRNYNSRAVGEGVLEPRIAITNVHVYQTTFFNTLLKK